MMLLAWCVSQSVSPIVSQKSTTTTASSSSSSELRSNWLTFFSVDSGRLLLLLLLLLPPLAPRCVNFDSACLLVRFSCAKCPEPGPVMFNETEAPPPRRPGQSSTAEESSGPGWSRPRASYSFFGLFHLLDFCGYCCCALHHHYIISITIYLVCSGQCLSVRLWRGWPVTFSESSPVGPSFIHSLANHLDR